MSKIEYFVANPAGNVTIFVTSEVAQKDYAEVTSQLLAIKEHCGEQVGFIKGGNRMEMSGLEFCGNASRSFALWYAKNRAGINGEGRVTVDVSGAETPLNVEVNTNTSYTKIQMPQPVSIRDWKEVEGVETLGDDFEGVLVDFGGIMHLILWDVEASAERFEKYNKFLLEKFDAPANGVMFLKKETLDLVPVVYVKDVDTTYFEGSCGSGSTACAIALAYKLADGEYSYNLNQPAGTITATTYINNHKLEKVFIEGPVEMGNTFELDF